MLLKNSTAKDKFLHNYPLPTPTFPLFYDLKFLAIRSDYKKLKLSVNELNLYD